MELYGETFDPSEVKDFTYDWTSRLGDGETVSSQDVTFIQTGGTTSPSDTLVADVSRVWLSGGAHGSRAIWSITVVTSAGRTLDVALAVDIVDNALVPPEGDTITVLSAQIADLKAQRLKVAMGESVIEVWRDGRRMKMQEVTLSEVDALIRKLEGELAAAQDAAGVTVTTPRRRAIRANWR